ncbi:MAG: PQQ-binding-like beta-propeller repeat protein [Mariniblastus sp.]
MYRTARFLALFIFASLSVASFAQFVNGQNDDWARWRGAQGNGVAAASQTPPTSFGPETNVVWKAKIPGRGHSSPIVVDDKIFLATAEKSSGSQSVVCVERSSGKQVWKTEINNGGLAGYIHRNNTHASSTVATDGERLFVTFSHHGNVEVAVLDFDGKEVWKKTVGVYKPAFPFGYGASPIIHDGMVIVTNENKGDAAVVAYKVDSGDEVWKIDRKGVTSYSTPVVANVAGRDQLLLSGGQRVASYDPATGEELWSCPASWKVTCGTMVWDGDLVFASGGFPSQETLAINAKTGEKVWSNASKCYEQSMIVNDGCLYGHADNGVIYCWRAKDGTELWKQRFAERKRATVSASPVLAGGNIYFTAENGECVVIKANPGKYEEVARNKLGNVAFSSMAICGNQIFTRVGEQTGDEFQWLYCLGEK